MSQPDFLIPVPPSIEAPNAMPLDQAVEAACTKLGLPHLGGPSGRGWSFHSTAQRCPHLFQREHVDKEKAAVGSLIELRAPAVPLQVGAFYHSLQALYYAPGLGPCVARERGLISAELWNAHGRGRKAKTIEIPPDAADQLLRLCKEMATPLEDDLQASLGKGTLAKRPSADMIDQAERAFDAHTNYYGAGREDVTPLAVEWFAENEALNYTCRYDMIGRLGENDPLGLPAGSVVIFERKTAAYLSEMAQTGWFLDGEVLGQIVNWQPSGCEDLFGPLAAVVVDIVTKKAKVPQMLRVVVPTNTQPVTEFGKWIRYTQSQIHLWKSTGMYPKYYTQCFDRWGKCGNWDRCAAGD